MDARSTMTGRGAARSGGQRGGGAARTGSTAGSSLRISPPRRDFVPLGHESAKFESMREPYYAALGEIFGMGYSTEDYIHNFPCFTGHQTLLRFLNLYELYRKVGDVAGHIGEIGVYKGACSLFFAKLVHLFEPHSMTVVHGFDTFDGNRGQTGRDIGIKAGGYREPVERVRRLIEVQGLSHILHLHQMDVVRSLRKFLREHPSLQFKLILLDAGIYSVVRTALPLIWERVTPGGIVILDQYNFEVAPGETVAVREVLPNARVRTLSPAWMPTAYIVKPGDTP